MLSRSFVRLGGLRSAVTFQSARTFHTTLSRASAEISDDEHEDAARTVQELVEEGMDVFRKTKGAYFNYSPDDLAFVVGKDYRDRPCPELRYKGQTQRFGLDHLTPWSVVYFAKMGTKGNLGEKIYNSSQIRENPAEANVEIGIIQARRFAEETFNSDFMDYCDWLTAIDEKFCDHITGNLDAYPKIKAKSGSTRGSSDVLRAIIRANMTSSVRWKKDESGVPVDDSEHVLANQRMFYRARKEADYFACAFDKEVYEKENLVRRKVHLADAYSNPIPLSEKPVSSGDIVSCAFTLNPSMFETFYGMKRSVSSVVILCKAERKTNANRQPYAGIKFAGGYAYRP